MLCVSFVAPYACAVGTGSGPEPRRRGRPRKAAAGKKRPRARQINASPAVTGKTARDAPAGKSAKKTDRKSEVERGEVLGGNDSGRTAPMSTTSGSTQTTVKPARKVSRNVSESASVSLGKVSGTKSGKAAAELREGEGLEMPSGTGTPTNSAESGLVASDTESKLRADDTGDTSCSTTVVAEPGPPASRAVDAKTVKEREEKHQVITGTGLRPDEKLSKQESKSSSKMRATPSSKMAGYDDANEGLPYSNPNHYGVHAETTGGANPESQREAMKRVVSAKNGMRGEDEPPDFLDELMQLFAAREVQAKADAARLPTDSDPVREMRELAAGLANEHASLFRYSGSTQQLLPFQLRAAGTATCGVCAGEGLRPCNFCGGAGSVPDTVCGPPGSVVVDANGREALVPPSDDLLDEYICGFCNGDAKEVCDACDGSGKINLPEAARGEERSGTGRAGAAGENIGKAATEEPSQADFIRKHADRIEIGADGTVILRAKARKKKVKAKGAAQGAAKSDAQESHPPPVPPAKRRRGRPRKGEEMDVLYPLKGPLPMGGTGTGLSRGPVGRSTDFVNTDYQVLRESRGAGFRRNTAAFSAALTRRLVEGDEPDSGDLEGGKSERYEGEVLESEGDKPESRKPEDGKPDSSD